MADTKIEMKVEEEIKPLKELCEKMVKKVSAEVDKGFENIETHELYEVADIIKDLSEAKKNTVEACYKIYILGAMEKAEEEGEFDDEEEPKFYRGQPRDSRGRFTSRGGRGGRRDYQEPPYYGTMTDRIGSEVYNPNDYLREMPERFYDGGRSGGSSSSGNSGNSGNNGNSSSSGSNGSRGSSGMSNQGGNRSGNNRGGRMYFDGEQDMSKVEKARQAYIEAMEMHSGNSQEEKQTRVREADKYSTAFSEDAIELSSKMSPEERTMFKTKLTNLINKM